MSYLDWASGITASHNVQSKSPKYLIIRLAGLGDIVTASTLVTRIRLEQPGSQISWMTGRGGAPLVRLFDGVDHVIEVDESALLRGSAPARVAEVVRTWGSLLRHRFDTIILAHPDPRYRLLVLPAGPGRVRRMHREVASRGNPIPGRFYGDEFARLLDPVGTEQVPADQFEIANARHRVLDLALPEAATRAIGGRRIDALIVPGGARNLLRDDPLRRWPVHLYAEVAAQLTNAGRSVAILGDAGDAWVRPAFDGIPVIDLVGKTDLPGTLRVMAESRVVVSHDTGPIHLARLVRTHLVALFGPTTPRQVLGDPADTTVLWGGAHLACRPCYDGRDFAPCPRNVCMEDIQPARVVAAVDQALQFLFD